MHVPDPIDVFDKTQAPRKIAVLGSGIVGLWQALTLARCGHDVRLVSEATLPTPTPTNCADVAPAWAQYTTNPFGRAASWWAAGMLAPECEAEIAEPEVVALGRRAIPIWRAIYPEVVSKGSLVIAPPRDQNELRRFARVTETHTSCASDEIATLEPDLADRFHAALFFPSEAHMCSRAALLFLVRAAAASGVTFSASTGDRGTTGEVTAECDIVVDARGLAARDSLPNLRGVRGEMAVLRTHELNLSRPVRLLHPRMPLYIVPWGDGCYMVGSSVIESEDQGPVTARSALEILGAAYAVHPSFGEAEVLEFGTGVRPAFPDNIPRVVQDGRTFHVNGMFRHGFLTAPALAQDVAALIETQAA